MSVEITVPTLGESIVEATVGRWLKAEGDTLTEGEPVVELETDKVNLEVVSPAAGTLQSVVKHEGDTVGIGEVLALVGEARATATPTSPSPAPAPAEATAAEDGRKQAGTAKAAFATTGDDGAPGRATPLARRMADEHGIDLHLVTGTGPGGRVTHDDVSAFIASRGGTGNGANALSAMAARAAAPVEPQLTRGNQTAQATPVDVAASALIVTPTTTTPLSVLPATPRSGRWEERVRMSRRRQTIARRLVEAKQSTAMLTTFNEVDMSAIIELRKRHKDTFKERHGVGLGYMSFFTRAVIGALKAYPRLNAEIQGSEMVLKHYYDIGIAVSTDAGLVVPVLRDADRMTFAEIERQIASLAARARNDELTLEELQGGTFTITNGGIFGSLLSTPILNAPQVGILGMHKIEERPIALNGQVVIHPMMYVAVSYDHRIVDGAESVGFLVRVKQLLEDPETLLLEG